MRCGTGGGSPSGQGDASEPAPVAESGIGGSPETPGGSIAAAAAAVSADVDPLEDIHTTADYRRDLVGTAVRRAHAQAGD